MTTDDVLLIDLPALDAAAVHDFTGGSLWRPTDGTQRISSAGVVIVAGLKDPEKARQELTQELVAGPLERRLAGGLPILVAGTLMEMLIVARDPEEVSESSAAADDFDVSDDDPALTQWVVSKDALTATGERRTCVHAAPDGVFGEQSGARVAGLDATIVTSTVLKTWSFDAHPLFTPPTVLWSADKDAVLALHNGPLTATCLDPRDGAGKTLVESWVAQHCAA